MRFSSLEKKDLFLAGLMISLAFAILLSGGYRSLLSLNAQFLFLFLAAFITAGLGFLLHELMHKYIAQSYGLQAEFRASYPALLLALLFSLFGFIIAAPGAVVISGLVNKERNGKISLAGPITNIVLALIFLIISLIPSSEFIHAIASYGLSINALLAAFNMIPVMPFDGAKVFTWNKGIYVITIIVAIALYVESWFL